MKKQSIPEHFEIRNTGMRPNWNSFWALEASDLSAGCASQHTQTTSLFSSKSQHSSGTGLGVRDVRFVTGSEWIGEWDHTNVCMGMGVYKMRHGVIYEGTMKAGLFEGIGVLKYPNGGCLEGLWYQGKLKYWQYDYADGLERDCQHWRYCSMPDRRFYYEHVHGFRPATTEHLTNDHPAREVPPGHYDVGQGFFNPKSHCVVDAVTGEVLSIPTASEEKWILERCRAAEPIGTVGFRPELYDNLFKMSTEKPTPLEDRSLSSKKEIYRRELSDLDSEVPVVSDHGLERKAVPEQPPQTEKEHTRQEREILLLLQQEESKLHSLNAFSHRKISLFDKLEKNSLPNELSADQRCSRATSFEGLLKKMAKEIELNLQSMKSEDLEAKDDTDSNHSNMYRLTQIINAYAEITYRRKTATSSKGSYGGFEQFRTIGKYLPSMSLTKSFVPSEKVSSLSSDLDEVHKLIHDRSVIKEPVQSVESIISATNL